jgi:chaperonin cofactor prefoldin
MCGLILLQSEKAEEALADLADMKKLFREQISSLVERNMELQAQLDALRAQVKKT